MFNIKILLFLLILPLFLKDDKFIKKISLFTPYLTINYLRYAAKLFKNKFTKYGIIFLI